MPFPRKCQLWFPKSTFLEFFLAEIAEDTEEEGKKSLGATFLDASFTSVT